MRIAFTHNLQLHRTEEEAEFDTPETVATLTEALRSLGHEVEPLEVSGPVSRVVARLEALNPDLVFNTAEGQRGRFREGFYPGVFEQLGFPFTGSDAYVCTLTLDKFMTRLALEGHGVLVPRGAFVDRPEALEEVHLRCPLIVKPNFEGSSKGITQDSVVEDEDQLRERAEALLRRYPAGILVEEYIEGKDVTVPFLEKASPRTGGVLAAAEYEFDVPERRYRIYDYELKQHQPDRVQVRVPADLPERTRQRLETHSRKVIRLLGIRDFGRLDYRVTSSGKIYFIEVNALPSLEPGASLYESARRAGLSGVEAVLEAILRSAAARYGLRLKARPRRRALRIGLTYNLKRQPPLSTSDDSEAEFDAPSTIAAVRDAIASYGYEVVELEATPELIHLLSAADVQVVFNLAEGFRGRNREAQVPALLELLDIEYTGSDPATLALALDKGLAKQIVRQAGIPTPGFVLMETGRERLPPGLSYPVIVKPVAEGSSKGVTGTSVIHSEEELREAVPGLVARYRQPALVEEFLEGREFTVALLGERRPRVLPPMEVEFLDPDNPYPVYTYAHKLEADPRLRYRAPAEVDRRLRREIERVARGVFAALGCRDVARIDLRLDARGRVHFMECNPLPGLTPGWSDLCLIAQSARMDYRTLIGEIMAPALRRYKARQRDRARSPSR